MLWVPTAGLHYDKDYWKNPDKFDPEHFSKEQEEARPPMVFTPFGMFSFQTIG
jgi:cytochrome P450 family 6